MTPQEWDRHDREWCASCDYREVGRNGCVIRIAMKRDSHDECLQSVFRRIGHCSQHKSAKQVKPKPRARRK